MKYNITETRSARPPLCTKPKSVQFSLLTEEDIKKLAVCQITSPVTFDALGYPLHGGLYDKRLGPLTDKADPCQTCTQNFTFCPGHFGYIKLPLPVINPLFHKVVAMILKNSCWECFHIQIPGHIKYTLDIQMKLLQLGKMIEALEIQQLMNDLMGRYDSLHEVPEEEMTVVKKYELLINQDSDESQADTQSSKNIEDLKNKIQSTIWKSMKTGKRCYNCRASPRKLTIVKQKIIVSEWQSDGTSAVGKKVVSKPVTPEKSRECIRNIWNADKLAMMNLFPVLKNINDECPPNVFFLDVLALPPCNVRPVNVVAGRMSEHAQTLVYKRIMQDILLLQAVMQVMQSGGNDAILPTEARAAYTATMGKTHNEKLLNMWEQLQTHVNGLVDNEGRLSNEQGLKQIIEKKSGIIRMHMMGKRVNFAARSVITPDPNLNIDEIGIPEVFAKHLTYPVPVTSWNVEEMRKLITNGPDVHPGAVLVEFEDGKVFRIRPDNPTQQEALLKRLLTPDGPDKGFKGLKTVHRHLCNGDVLLLNRQPTLHRPSIMAHTARVLKNEKVLRLHYANCKAYNADFDGDEMNAHFPQNEVARSEGYNLVNVANQYLGPKDGTPLSGLIQDHMIAGVKLSLRGRFFNQMDYQQLVYQALSNKLSDINLLPPTILKPQRLWSGKQVLSTVILNIIPKGRSPIHLSGSSKISVNAWINSKPREWKAGGSAFKDPKTMSEAEVVIRGGELLVGILDKTHYGATPYGLVHCMYELYGGACSIKLLSAFAKLFTSFLQTEGFTLGVEDILVLHEADKQRTEVIKKSREIGAQTMCKALNVSEDLTPEEIVAELQVQAAQNNKLRAIIDRQYKSALDSFTNDINKACLPAGLICKFPYNNLQLMVQSGAKGSTVNTMQISCLLGQIELEGKRPPVMISGKSLPSFPVTDFSPRAGGYIDARFMTGIQPQEFFFHCMAGREGLIDTAVKTSRSGYLQRCLIKHLEGVKVGYDLTVRDSDKSVIQFLYGEDGLDISKAQFLKESQLKFLCENAQGIVNDSILKQLKADPKLTKIAKHEKKIESWVKKKGNALLRPRSAFTLFSAAVEHKVKLDEPNKRNTKTGRTKKTRFITELWSQAGDDIKETFVKEHKACLDPVISKYQPDAHFGVLNERLKLLLEGVNGEGAEDMLKFKAMQSLCAPGEPVGLLAAQSIGEPSTQMTLNTFHFAGRGEMNVTLGIPRLREILMIASKHLKTPSMEVPFLDVPNLEARSNKLIKMLTRVVVADVLEKVVVSQEMQYSPVRQFKYTMRLHCIPYYLYKNKYNVKPKFILKYLEKNFFKLMFAEIQKRGFHKTKMANAFDEPKKPKPKRSEDDEDEPEETNDKAEDVSSEDEPEDVEDAKTTYKYSQKFDKQESDSENEDMQKLNKSDVPEEYKEIKGEKFEGAEEDTTTCNETVQMYSLAERYKYDSSKHEWCELDFHLPIGSKQLDLSALLKDVAGKAVLWETPGIRRAISYMNKDRLTLRTDGINFHELFKYNDLLDLNQLYSNDIHHIADVYGIEAANKVIVKEVSDVFKVYGIDVDSRHLSLIADYMTFGGTFEPFNRRGMESSASPLQQMSFESSLTFLKAAVINGKRDDLQNPSSCLMIGKPCNMGTGSFSLLQNLKAYECK